MKINGLILFAILMLAGSKAFAGTPVGMESQLNSKYTESHSSMTVSSATLSVGKIEPYLPLGSRWRQVTIDNQKNTASVFYRADGSSANITAVGQEIQGGARETLETGTSVHFQLEAGTSPVIIRIYESKR